MPAETARESPSTEGLGVLTAATVCRPGTNLNARQSIDFFRRRAAGPVAQAALPAAGLSQRLNRVVDGVER